MTNVTTRLLINRFDSDPTVEEVELDHQEPISSVKERLFAEDITNHDKLRIIHGGRPLSDDTVPSGLRGYKAGEKLVLTVFITKPDTLEPEAESAPKRDLWKWSTSAWIMVVATLWCYKFKLADSFRRFPLFVLYVATFICLHMVLSRLINFRRVSSG